MAHQTYYPPPPGADTTSHGPAQARQPNVSAQPTFLPPPVDDDDEHGFHKQYYPPPPPPPAQGSPATSPSVSQGAFAPSSHLQPDSHSQSLPLHTATPVSSSTTTSPSFPAPPTAPPPQSPPLTQTPQQPSFVPAPSASADEVGTFNGGSYRISHRSTNTLVTIQLAINCPLIARPGVMIAMSHTVTLSGSVKFSFKKLLAGGSLASSTFTGPGEVLLAPSMLGDVIALRLNSTQPVATAGAAAAAAASERKGERIGLGAGTGEVWRVGRDSWVANTQGVTKDVKAQTLGKALFSGEGLWTYTVAGSGICWVASFGAIIRKELRDGEKYIIDNGHLVAWNCKYVLERVASGGIISELSSSEGLVCKFTGPGIIYLQTRNPGAFQAWVNGQNLSKQ